MSHQDFADIVVEADIAERTAWTTTPWGDLRGRHGVAKTAPPSPLAPGLAIFELYMYLNADPGSLWSERLPIIVKIECRYAS
jgi:hypothetical protein